MLYIQRSVLPFDSRLPRKFWDRVQFIEDGCWIWTGAVSLKGYGVTQRDYVKLRLHRDVFKTVVGDPGSLVVDHLCRRRDCMNPQHMEAVTDRENVRRGFGPTAINARKTHCDKGHELSGSNVIWRTDSGLRKCKTCQLATQRRCYRLKRMREGAIS